MEQKTSFVAFCYACEEPNDAELTDMLDCIVRQALGPEGFRALVHKGDHVVVKPNIVNCDLGARGDRGRGCITDPRITRYVAEKVREIIGWDEDGADLRVVEACHSDDPDPSTLLCRNSFYYARLNRVKDNTVSPEDICYDQDRDGLLDGASRARLVNLDAIGEEGRDLHIVHTADGRDVKVAFPRFLRTREEANGEDEFTDVFIGLPVFKTHGMMGCTGAIKNHYGIRKMLGCKGDTGRHGHSGFHLEMSPDYQIVYVDQYKMSDYLIAQHKIRTYDFVLMDCLTLNRKGPGCPRSNISITLDSNAPIDYILTNALMASTDPVAIDTVETALAGYKPESVELLRIAAENGLGVTDPAYIQVGGAVGLTNLKNTLLRVYGESGKYPPADHGTGRTAPDLLPHYVVLVDETLPKPDEQGVCHVRYRIVSTQPDCVPDIRRVELVFLSRLYEARTEGDLMSGCFDVPQSICEGIGGAYLCGIVLAWDGLFNCVESNLEVFITPPGCED